MLCYIGHFIVSDFVISSYDCCNQLNTELKQWIALSRHKNSRNSCFLYSAESTSNLLYSRMISPFHITTASQCASPTWLLQWSWCIWQPSKFCTGMAMERGKLTERKWHFNKQKVMVYNYTLCSLSLMPTEKSLGDLRWMKPIPCTFQSCTISAAFWYFVRTKNDFQELKI